MYQAPLPEPYPSLSDEELIARIQGVKQRLKKKVVILTHHYQRPEVVALGDVRGDSLKLAQYAASQDEADYVVYCGVHFMAESADILKQKPSQTIILPDLGAGCDMADMADVTDAKDALEVVKEKLSPFGKDVLPITYINSSAALKALVGKNGGVVCTSTNAPKIVQWALEQGKVIFFFPDEHLGRNTAKRLGVPLENMKLWNPNVVNGGIESFDKVQVVLWKGHCPVHLMFTVRQIESLRQKDPSFKVIVHPECSMEVVDAADAFGSTEFIVSTIAQSPAGSHWAVGTELNLVNRIAKENPDKVVVSLNPYMCLCGTMNRIDLKHLAWALDNIESNHVQNVIRVDPKTKHYAKLSLDRMLDMSVSFK